MKISKIEPQKKNRKRCSIFIDGEFRFGLPKEIVLQHGLYEGVEITDREIDEIVHHADKAKILERAFKILHYRERSVKELRDRLMRIGFDNSLVDEVIDELIADKTLDDERFARAFVNDYTRLKPKGNRFILSELIRKGVDREIITNLLDARDEGELIRIYIEKKTSNLDMKNPKERQKLVRRLLVRGFTPSIVYEIIKE
ncbi:MAG: RecX family transcriptional regulator [bacterium]